MALITSAQAAERLSVSPGRVRQLIVEGRIRATKYASTALIEESEIRKFRRKKRGRPRNPRTGQ